MSGHHATSTDGLEERFDREKTRQLFADFAKSRDAKVREELVVAHLNLVRQLDVAIRRRRVGDSERGLERREADAGVRLTPCILRPFGP